MTTGQHNVYALVSAADQTLLNELLVDRLPAVRGLRGLTTARIVHLFSGMQWRLGGITATQAKAVTEDPAPAVARHDFDDFDRQLYMTLQHDGRLGVRDLAARVDRSPAAVRKRLDILGRSRLLTFRTDFARPMAGWPTNVVLKLRVGEAVADAGRALVHWPETRVCADLIGGAANLFVTAQLHDLAALDDLTTRLHTEFPGVTVVDQRVLLRAVKSFGRLLGADGRAHEVVPVDLWAPIA